MPSSKVYTLYHGTCIKYELNLKKIVGGEYLYQAARESKSFHLSSWAFSMSVRDLNKDSQDGQIITRC